MYRLIEKLHLERYLNTRLILAIDLAVSGLASLCALVSVKLLLHLNISDYTLLWLCCSVVYSFVTFYLLKTYHSVIRHSTLRELSKFVVATFSKEILLGLTVVLYPPAPQFSLHILALLLLDLLLTLCGLILIRVAMIIIYDLVKDNLKYRKQRQQVLVYGLSEKSVSLVTRLQSSPHYKIVGFLTFGRNMKNHTIAECPVYYFENEYSIRYLRQRYDIDAVLFPTNEEAQAEQERLIRYCVENNLKILIAPPIDEVIDGKIMPSLSSIDGLGDKAAEAVVDAVKDGAFLSIEDFSNRSKVNGTICTLMADLGLLPDLPKSNQLSLFDL